MNNLLILTTRYNHKNDPLISQIRCKLYTGRTHQIRVHLDYIGHPLICDQKYGKGFNTKLKLLSDNYRNQLKIDRHALHSSKLSFRHPIGNKPMTFESELPDDLKLLKNMLSGI